MDAACADAERAMPNSDSASSLRADSFAEIDTIGGSVDAVNPVIGITNRSMSVSGDEIKVELIFFLIDDMSGKRNTSDGNSNSLTVNVINF